MPILTSSSQPNDALPTVLADYAFETAPFTLEFDAKDFLNTLEPVVLGLSQQDENFYPEFIEFSPIKVGEFTSSPGLWADITVDEGIAYWASQRGEVYIINATVPVSLQLLSIYNSPLDSGFWSLQKVDDLLFLGEFSLAHDAWALRIVDVHDPLSPLEIGSYESQNSITQGDAIDVAIDGNFAHINVPSNGYYIIEVSDPTNPTLESIFAGANLPSQGGRGITVLGDYSYLIAYGGQVYAFDVSNPSSPQHLSTTQLGEGYNIRSQGNFLFAACRNQGLKILDVSNRASPKVLHNFNRGVSVLNVHVKNNLLTLSDNVGFFVLDIADPSVPALILSSSDTVNPRATFIEDNQLYAIGHNDRMAIYDLSQAVLVGTPSISDVAQYQMRLGVYANAEKQLPFQLTINQLPYQIGRLPELSVFLASNLSELVPLPIYFKDPDDDFYWSSVDCQPLQLTWELQAKNIHQIDFECGIYGYHFVEEKNIYMVACGQGGGFRIYDLSSPESPDLLFTHRHWPRSVKSVDYQDNLAYIVEDHVNPNVGVYDYFLRIFNIEDPTTPSELSVFRVPARHYTIRVFSNLAVGLGSDSYFLYDISDSTLPQLLTSQPFAQGHSTLIRKDTLYVSSVTDGLFVYDITDPTNPIQVMQWGDTIATMVIHRDILYLAEVEDGISFLDMKNLTSPVLLNRFNTTEFSAESLALRHNMLTVTSSNKAYLMDVSDLKAPALIGHYEHASSIIQAELTGFSLVFGDRDQAFNFVDAASLYKLFFHPNGSSAGNYGCTVSFVDSLGGSVSQFFTLRIEGPPQVNSVLPAQLAIVGQPFNYFIEQGTFTDPNFDPIGIVARGENGSLSWAYFDGVSQVTGLPGAIDVGSETIIFELTDHHPQLPNIYTTLTLVVEEYLPPHHLVSGRYFEYVLPSFVFSQIGNTTQLAARKTDGEALFPWMTFDNQTSTFSGEAPTNYSDNVFIQLEATNGLKEDYTRTLAFIFSENQPPYVQNYMPDVVTYIGTDLRVPISDTFFSDGNQDKLTYYAREAGSDVLPPFVHLDGKLLIGKATRSDLKFWGDKRYKIELTATDGWQNATMPFNIDVKGTSYGELLLKVGSPIFTILGLGLTAYHKRRYILNRMNREKYQLPAVQIKAGKSCTISLQTSAQTGSTIQLKFREPQQSRWCGLFGSRYASLFNGELPHWLYYDISSGELRSERVPDRPFPEGRQPVIQVKNKQGVIQEQFAIEVVYPEAQLTSDIAGSSDIPLLPAPLPPDSGVEMPSYNP